uniref:Protein kinase domain-containing protein n=1 Tax=Oryza meridionalis TaxID=40149 RepID=A0A0E0F8G0_9ORYZ
MTRNSGTLSSSSFFAMDLDLDSLDAQVAAGRPGRGQSGQGNQGRVQTVSQNKEDCELAERADLILDLLGRLQKSKVIEDPDMWKPTERLRSTLRRACEVIEFCQERSCAYRFCKSDHIAKELRKVLKALKFCVAHLTALTTIINGDQTTRYFLVQQTPDVVKLQSCIILLKKHQQKRRDQDAVGGIPGRALLPLPTLACLLHKKKQGRLNEGLEVAVKRASYVDKIPLLENELDLIPKLQHTNIVKLLGY